MLEIVETKATLTNVVPRVGEGKLGVDVTIATEVAGGVQLLRQLHAPQLAAVCWTESGEPAVDDWDIRTRHKLENCTVTLCAGRRKVCLDGDLVNIKCRPTQRGRLELMFKCVASASSADLAALGDLWLAESMMLTARERQMGLEDVD